MAEVFETPFAFLMDPTNHEERVWDSPQGSRRYYAMPHEDRLIWGATAGILRALWEQLFGPESGGWRRRQPAHPTYPAARLSRSLIASPSPSLGIGATAMAVGCAPSASRRQANRLAAASRRSPTGLRFQTCGVSGACGPNAR